MHQPEMDLNSVFIILYIDGWSSIKHHFQSSSKRFKRPVSISTSKETRAITMNISKINETTKKLESLEVKVLYSSTSYSSVSLIRKS